MSEVQLEPKTVAQSLSAALVVQSQLDLVEPASGCHWPRRQTVDPQANPKVTLLLQVLLSESLTNLTETATGSRKDPT